MAHPTGVYAASVTPRLADSGLVDIAAAVDLIEFLGSSGIDGIVLLGATGDFPHFDLSERARFAADSIRRSTVPVLVDVSHSSLDGTVRLAREAIYAGAAGLLVMPPYYFRYRPAEVLAFLQAAATRIGSGVPLLLYNIPFFTSPLDQETTISLLASGTYAGIKDSSGDWQIMSRLLDLRSASPFQLLAGNDSLFARARAAGADGCVSGVACAAPELLVALNRAIAAGDRDQTSRLDARLQDFIARIDVFPTPIGIREAAAARGLTVGPHAVPLSPEAERQAAEFREWFTPWLQEVRGETVPA